MRSNAIPPPIPVEFEDLLSASGKRVLAGTHALCGTLANPRTRFLARGDLLDCGKAERLRRALEASLAHVAGLSPATSSRTPAACLSSRQEGARPSRRCGSYVATR